MPQLNPAPWFFIMLASWFTFSFILQPKLLLLTSTNLPINEPFTTMTTPSWNWPWT